MQKRILTIPPVLIVSGLLLAGTALAEPPGRDGMWRMGPPDAEQKLAHLNQALDLSDEQSQQMLELLQRAEAEHQALRAQVLEEMRPELCALKQNTETDILAILTPEQGELFLQLREQNQSQTGKHRHNRGMDLDCESADS